MTKEEAINEIKSWDFLEGKEIEAIHTIIPELAESEDERMRKMLIDRVRLAEELTDELREWILTYLEKLKEQPTNEEMLRTLRTEYEKGVADTIAKYEQKEQKPIKMEVYEVGKGTTICGQDYKCKKDYKEGNCWYIKDVIYHCSRDGYLNDQNGVSWSCTPEWFKEYIYSNAEWAEKEKSEFVGGQFIQCNCTLDDGLKKGEHYWLEYVGDDTYVGRSDNILNQKFHITPRQLFTLFTQQLEERQKEQKPVTNDRQQECPYKGLALVKNFFGEYKRKCKLPNKACDSKECEQWNELQSEFKNINKSFEDGKKEVVAHPERYGLCRPTGWGEEDKKMINHLIEALTMWANGLITILPSQAEEYVKRLKSLRPQPKQDVSLSLREKEIICLKRALDYLRKEHNRYVGEDFTNEIAVLEWLITHPISVSDTHWKPSEEQMKQLKDAADLPEFGPMVTTRKQFPDLESLYEHFLRN